MINNKIGIILMTSLSLIIGKSLNAQSVTQASVKKANVFFRGALLEQEAQVNLSAGTSEIIIRNVAQGIDISSLQMKMPQGVSVINVDLRQWTPTSVEMKSTKDVQQQEWLTEKEKLKSLEVALQTVKSSLEFWKNSAQPQNINLVQLEQLMKIYSEKASSLLQQEQDLQKKIVDQQIVIQRLEMNNPLLTTQSSKSEILVQISSTRSLNAKIDFTYFTSAANWNPEYELSLDESSKQLDIDFKAALNQQTGMKWENVALIFSTAQPSNYLNLPSLSPWYFGAIEHTLQLQARAKSMADASITFEEMNYQAAPPGVVFEEGMMNNEYAVNGQMSINSGGAIQKISILKEQVSASFEYLLMPQMAQKIYIVALVQSQKNQQLLPGTAVILKDQNYLGKTTFDPHQLKDTLQLAMGVEERVLVQRLKTKDFLSSKSLGAKQIREYEFKISLENLKSETIKVKVQERIPLSTDKNIEIHWSGKNINGQNGVLNREQGIITWEIELAPKSKQEIQYGLEIKYPKDTQIPTIY